MNIYQTIWLTPVKSISKADQKSLIILPVVIAGASIGLDMSDIFRGISNAPLWIYLPAIFTGLALSFFVFRLIWPGLIFLTGKIWGGQSSMREMANAVSISLFPQLLILVYQLLLLTTGTEPWLSNVNGGLLYVIQIWSFGLLILGVAKVQNFRYGLSLLNIVISCLPVVILSVLRNAN